LMEDQSGNFVGIDNQTLLDLRNYLESMYPIDNLSIETTAVLDVSAINGGLDRFNYVTPNPSTDDFNAPQSLLGKIANLQILESADDDIFYYGLWTGGESTFSGDNGGTLGIAFTQPVASAAILVGIGVIFPEYVLSTTAHELGHNHGLPHIICDDETNDRFAAGASYPDENYPYNQNPIGNGSDNTTGNGDDYGRIGKMGYDFRFGNYVSKTLYHDVMSYCDRVWISDYHYNKLNNFQDALDSYANPKQASQLAQMSTSSINGKIPGTFVTGAISGDGQVKILDTILVTKRYRPFTGGTFTYRVETISGEIYEGSFLPSKMDHASGEYFRFMLPTQTALQSVRIFQASDGLEVLNQDFGPIVSAKIDLQLRRLGETQWEIPPTFRSQRIVRSMTPSPRVLIYDADTEAKTFIGIEGETIEIQYQTGPGRVEKLLIELQ